MKKSFPFIETHIADIFESPGFSTLPTSEKEVMAEKMRAHAEKLVLDTFMNRLDDAKTEEIRGYLKTPEVLAQKFEEYAAGIPGLAEDIEARLGREFEMMKSLV